MSEVTTPDCRRISADDSYLVVPPLPREAAAWFRAAILGAHYVPAAGLYEPMTARDEAEMVRSICSAAIVAVRREMIERGELERTKDDMLNVGPAAPRHPCG